MHPADGDEIELAALHALHDRIDVVRRHGRLARLLLAQGRPDPHAAHGARRLTRESAGPPGEGDLAVVTFQVGERRIAEAPGRRVEQVDARVGECAEVDAEFVGVGGLEDRVVLLRVLREAVEQRRLRADGLTDRRHHRCGEAAPRRQVAAPLVGAAVGIGPDERVQQVSVAAVQGDPVEPGLEGIPCRPGEGADHVGDVRLGHRLHRRRPALDAPIRVRGDARRTPQARRTHGVHRHEAVAAPAIEAGVGAPQRTDVPQLRHDPAARGVHGVRHHAPRRHGLRTVEARDRGVVDRRGVVHADALGDDQPGTACGAGRVVVPVDLVGQSARAAHPRHRRHDQAVGQVQ